MRARVCLQPRQDQEGLYQDEILINDDILRNLKLSQKLHQSKWSVGLLYPAKDTLEVDNSTGRYNTAAGSTSVFSVAGADKCRVRVEYPASDAEPDNYQTIYRGLVATKASTQNPGTGKARWTLRTPDLAFVDQSLNPGLITQGMTVKEAIEACFQDLNIAEAIPNLNLDNFYDPNFRAGGTVINDEEKLLGEERAADNTLQKLLQAMDCILTYVPYSNQARVMRRAEPPSAREDGTYATGWSSGFITEPLKMIAVEDGVEQVYNSVSATTGVPGTFSILTEEDRGSISQWGRRSLPLDLSWVRDLDQCQNIVRNLLSRLATPQRVVELIVPSLALTRDGNLQIFGQEAIVGGLVGCDIPAKAPRSAPRVGNARVGEFRTMPITYGAISGSFYIEEIVRSLRGDIAKLTLREYISTE